MITANPNWLDACKRMGIVDMWARHQQVLRARKVYDAVMLKHLESELPFSEHIMPSPKLVRHRPELEDI